MAEVTGKIAKHIVLGPPGRSGSKIDMTRDRRSAACTFEPSRAIDAHQRVVEVSRCRVCGATRRVEVG
jgi:hypothetical protein